MKFNDIKEKIENLIKNKKRGIKIILNAVYSPFEVSKKEIKNFCAEWRKKVAFIDLQKIHNWANGKYFYKISLPCLLLNLYATILVNRDLIPCCLDYEEKIKLGNIDKESLKTIWGPKKCEEFRKDAISLEKKMFYVESVMCFFLSKNSLFFASKI
ncbi:MAG: SPASM domain-containing protein [Candidatus Omnitrophica bacterium]|nr:SPASM domain-containing protein [Candidatus Omnitrophota bacterium]